MANSLIKDLEEVAENQRSRIWFKVLVIRAPVGASPSLNHAATCCGLGRSSRFHGSFARAYAAIVFGLTLLPHMWTCWDRVNRCPLWPRSMM